MLALFAGCDDLDSELQGPIADLRTRDLDVLVLPESEVGSLVRGFDIDSGSGPSTNADSADSSLNPDDTEADLEEAGRIEGYSLDFTNPSPGDDDVLQVGTSVTLWEDADLASAAFEDAVQEFFDFEGEEVEGLTLVSVEEFDVDLGDESTGLRIEMEVPGVGSIYGTAVYTRLDRLGLNANMIGLGDESFDEDMIALAETHLDWVTGVLLGELDPDPVEIPEPADPVGPDTGAPPLDQVSLQAEDLPAGFVETERGFETDDQAGLYDYTSAFESVAEYAPIGNSRIASIENNVIVYESAIEAQAFIGAIAGLLEGDSGAEFMLQIFQGEGVPATSVETERRDIDLGDQTVAVSARTETDIGNVILSFILTRTGATVTAFIVVGEAESYDLQDIGPIVEAVVDRVVSADQLAVALTLRLKSEGVAANVFGGFQCAEGRHEAARAHVTVELRKRAARVVAAPARNREAAVDQFHRRVVHHVLRGLRLLHHALEHRQTRFTRDGRRKRRVDQPRGAFQHAAHRYQVHFVFGDGLLHRLPFAQRRGPGLLCALPHHVDGGGVCGFRDAQKWRRERQRRDHAADVPRRSQSAPWRRRRERASG